MSNYQIPQSPFSEEELLSFCSQISSYLQIIETRVSALEVVLSNLQKSK